MRLQRAVVIALGNEAAAVAAHFVEVMRGMSLPSSIPYPEFLYDVMVLRQGGSESIFPGAIEFGPVDSSTAISILESQRDLVANAFRSAMRRINDRSRLIELERTSGHREVDQWIRCYILASTCDGFGSYLFRPTMRLIHEEYTGQPALQTIGLLLLPEMFEGADGTDRQIKEARTYGCLQVTALSLAKPAQYELPQTGLGKVWLIDSVDQTGRCLGPFEELVEPLGEVLACMVTQSLFDQGQAEAARVFSGLGFSQLVFPKHMVVEQAADRLVLDSLSKFVLRRKMIDSDIVVLDVKEFVTDRLDLDTLSEQMQRDQHGKNLIPRFAYDADSVDNVESFIRDLEEAANNYERGLPSIKRNLIQRAQELTAEKIEIVRNKIAGLVDRHESGLFYARAFLDELRGQNADYRFVSGDRIEESYNLETGIQDQKRNIFLLGGGAELQSDLNRVEATTKGLCEELSLLRREKEDLERSLEEAIATGQTEEGSEPEEVSLHDSPDESPPQVATLENKLQTVSEKESAIEEQLVTEEKKLADIRTRIETLEKAWKGTEERKRAFSEILHICSENVELHKRELRWNAKQLERTVDRIDETWSLSRRYVRFLAVVGTPALLILATILASLSVRFGYALRGQAVLWILAALGCYAAGAGWLFYKNILRAVRRAEKEKHTLDTQQATLRSELEKSFSDYSHVSIELQIRNETIEQVESLRTRLSEDVVNLTQLLDECLMAQEQLCQKEYGYSSSSFRNSVVDASDVTRLYEQAIELVDEEISRFFLQPSPPLSAYAKQSDEHKTLMELLERYSRDKFEELFSDISIEDLIFKKYDQLCERLPPEDRMKAFLDTLEPFIRLRDAALKRYASQSVISIGVQDAEKTQLHQAGLPEGSVVVFSHRDPTRIIGAQVTPHFALEDLASLNEYAIAFEACDTATQREILPENMHPDVLVQRKDEGKTGDEVRQTVIRCLALGVLHQDQTGILHESVVLGATISDACGTLSQLEERERLRSLNMALELTVGQDDQGIRSELRERVHTFRNEAAEWLTEADVVALAETLEQLAPIV